MMDKEDCQTEGSGGYRQKRRRLEDAGRCHHDRGCEHEADREEGLGSVEVGDVVEVAEDAVHGGSWF